MSATGIVLSSSYSLAIRLILVYLALIIYEIFLTFEREIVCIWRRKFSAVTVLYACMRYALLIDKLIALVSAITPEHLLVSTNFVLDVIAYRHWFRWIQSYVPNSYSYESEWRFTSIIFDIPSDVLPLETPRRYSSSQLWVRKLVSRIVPFWFLAVLLTLHIKHSRYYAYGQSGGEAGSFSGQSFRLGSCP